MTWPLVILRPIKAAALKPLSRHAKVVANPPQQFDEVVAADTEHEHMGAYRMDLQWLPDLTARLETTILSKFADTMKIGFPPIVKKPKMTVRY